MAIDIQIKQVSHTFQDKEQRLTALQNINLSVNPGEFVSLVGPSGCGKSTLLRLVAGLSTPTSGNIRLAGQAAGKLRAKKEIGWMSQQGALLPWRTVLDNVRLPLWVNRQKKQPPHSPEQLLEMVGLQEFAAAYPATLSGGMQQRVALARTLATGASLWLMDEPFAALDELTREALSRELLVIWRKFQPTVLWVTHHIAEAVRLSDKIVILSARPGQIQTTLTINIPRPRDDTTPQFQAVVKEARRHLGRKPAAENRKQRDGPGDAAHH